MKKSLNSALTPKHEKTNLLSRSILSKLKHPRKPMKAPTTRAHSSLVGSQSVSHLLAEALKQPGVQTILDVFEVSEKYHRQSQEVTNIIDRQRYLSSYSSCHTTPLA
jgi:hypothetical protein